MTQPAEQENPFLGMDYDWLDVLTDMVDDFWDKDRHGELAGGWGYDHDKQEALGAMGSLIKEAARRRGLSY
ncbi:hypothetical protein OV320_7806 [Actinobacteria bacterium OV320]|nr:hypothetical protein OV320_7806 [Actinobacteria bacterium OV320]